MEKEEWDRLTKLHKIVPISNKSKLKELEKEVLYYKLKAGENTIYKILSELPVLIQEIKRLTFLTKRKSKIVNTIGKVSEIQIDIARNTNIRNYININSSKKAHQVLEKLDIAPKHAKSTDQSDPLYAARVKEVTSLYRLKVS